MPDDPGIRVDKWLWHARFFRTRTLATALVADKGIRVNGQRTTKPAATIRPGDVLTFPQAGNIRVVRVLGLADRRGPPGEASVLYEDITPQPGA